MMLPENGMGTEDDVKIFDGENPGFPAFAPSGFLPAGIHDCSFSGFARGTAFNVDRLKMWRQLASFLAHPILSGKFSYAYLGGEFTSNKALPSTVDVLLETAKPYGPEGLAAIAEFFTIGIERFETLYGITLHFHLRGAPPELFDGPFAELKGGRPSEIYSNAGLVRLQLNGVDSLVIVRTSIRGE